MALDGLGDCRCNLLMFGFEPALIATAPSQNGYKLKGLSLTMLDIRGAMCQKHSRKLAYMANIAAHG